MKTLTIPWSDDLALGGRCDRVGPVQMIMGQAITIECRSSDVPPVSADGRTLEAWLALGRADGTVLYHWTNSRFTNRAGDFDLPLTADETALAPGAYYLEVRDATAGNEHVLARALLNLIASPSYGSIVPPPPLVVDTAHGGTGANLTAAGPGFLRFLVAGGPAVVQALALTDLPAGGAGSGDVLAWNGTHWVPSAAGGGGGGMAIGGAVAGGAAGRVLVVGAGPTLVDFSDFTCTAGVGSNHNDVTVPGGGANVYTAPSLRFANNTSDGFGSDGSGMMIFQNGLNCANISQTVASYRVPSHFQFSWASATNNLAGADTGIKRQAAGAVKPTDGGSGNGWIVLGNLALPADGAVSPGDLWMCFDSTNGAAKLLLKGKTAGGTVVTGTILLS